MGFIDFIQVIILGIVQGISEFLPISSSAHLIIFRDILKIGSFITKDISLSFDIALHFGTLLAILAYFYQDFLKMFKDGFNKKSDSKEKRLFWYLVIATIPAALVGYLFEEVIDEKIRGSFYLIVIVLAIVGVLIYLIDKYSKQTNSLSKMNVKQAFLIGCSQILALIPGFSRSGTTIATARFLKLNREDAAKFSFYLSAPIVLGAVTLDLIKGDMTTLIFNNLFIFITGLTISFLTGFLCIKFLLQYLKKHDFKIFMWYRLIVAFFILIVLFTR